MKAMKIGVGLAMGTAIAVAGVFLLAGPKAGADSTDAAQVAQGKAAYAGQCASCHGARLAAQRA